MKSLSAWIDDHWSLCSVPLVLIGIYLRFLEIGTGFLLFLPLVGALFIPRTRLNGWPFLPFSVLLAMEALNLVTWQNGLSLSALALVSVQLFLVVLLLVKLSSWAFWLLLFNQIVYVIARLDELQRVRGLLAEKLTYTLEGDVAVLLLLLIGATVAFIGRKNPQGP